MAAHLGIFLVSRQSIFVFVIKQTKKKQKKQVIKQFVVFLWSKIIISKFH